MKYQVCTALFLAIIASALVIARADAQTPATASTNESASDVPAEVAAIRAASQAFVEAFNNHDAKAIAEQWTEDGDYVDEAGRNFVGQSAIESGYQQFFSEYPDRRIRIIVDSVRLLSPSAAIEDGRAIMEPTPVGAPGISKYTAVHVKKDGKWLMASVRDTWIEAPSTHANIEDLEWLIGTWSAEEHGVKTESICQWVANKSFVERKYTITQSGGAQSSGVQLIGWNAQRGHVQSWNFSADGGHAIGVWHPTENGWLADVHGVTGSGLSTSAINLLKRLDDNAYVWQSVQRTLGDSALPDTDEVVIKRSVAR